MSNPAPSKKRSAKTAQEKYDAIMASISFMQLQSAKNSLLLVNNRHSFDVPGFIVHSAKAIVEIEWMLNDLKKRYPKEAKKEGIE